jgi:SM-20-related protein
MITPDIYLEQLEKDGLFFWDNFLNEAETASIRLFWDEQIKKENLRKAGIGKKDSYQIDKSERGDYIAWIDQTNPDEATKNYLDKICQLITDLNRSFYLGIRDYECHFALYPAGASYARHVDRHRSGSSRVVSFVFYLNADWQTEDGGQLLIYDQNRLAAEIIPQSGRLAVFLSEKEHEVAITQRPRMSITGWMLNA